MLVKSLSIFYKNGANEQEPRASSVKLNPF